MLKKKGALNNKNSGVGTSRRSKRYASGAIINGGLDTSLFSDKGHKSSSFLHNGSPVANLILRLTNRKQDKQQENARYKRYNNQTFQHTTIEHLAYKGLTKDNPSSGYRDMGPMGARHYLVLADDLQDTSGYAEILKIGGASLSNLPANLVLERISMFIDFLRAFKANMEFIALPLPNDSREQQHEWSRLLNSVQRELLEHPNLSTRVRNQLLARKQMIKENLQKFKETDRNLVNQGFVLIIFEMGRGPQVIRKLDDDTQMAFRFGGDALNLSRMSSLQKEEFLRHLNNPNDVQTM